MRTNIFKQAVEQCDATKAGFHPGLQALKGDSAKVKAADTKKLLGSVDIDACTKLQYPNAPRWDYAVGYNQQAIFIEVHPANTSNVKEMTSKAQWLESWLKTEGKVLASLRKDNTCYWIPSGKVAILKTSPQRHSLAKHNLVITKCPFVLE